MEQNNMGMPQGGPPKGMPMGGPPKGMPMGGPPKGMPMGGPPNGMPQGGPPNGMPQGADMLSIKPAYDVWRSVFLRIDVAIVAMVFILNLVTMLTLSATGIEDGNLAKYAVLGLGVPTLINIVILCIAMHLNKVLKDRDDRVNVVPSYALIGIMLVVSFTHCTLPAIFCSFCLPIFMMSAFGDARLCKKIFISSVIAFMPACIRYCIVQTGVDVVRSILQCCIVLATLLISLIITMATINMTSVQKEKLIQNLIAAKKAQALGEAANEAKTAFLANMSHEIRTPINAILGMNEMVLRETKSEQIKEYSMNIHAAGNSLLYIINDVLDFSKIESGRMDIVENVYDVSSLVHDSYNMILEKVNKKGLDLKINCANNVPSKLKGDEPHVRQVIINILSNAVKYTEKGTVTFGISGDAMEDKGFMLRVTVEDTGIGMKPESKEQLFSQFTRFDLDRNRNIEGTGLGLAITKQLVTLMKGTIEVESEYEKGTKVTISVPQTIIDAVPVTDIVEDFEKIKMENYEYKQSFEAPDVKVLVVDDVAVNLKVFKGLLKDTRINVDTALSGDVALELMQRTKYDLVFMDHMMPGMDGIQTLTALRKIADNINIKTPVIMLTANAIAGVREQYLSVGFADYLSKPIVGEKLERMILKFVPGDKVKIMTDNQKEDGANEGKPNEGEVHTNPQNQTEDRSAEKKSGITAMRKLLMAYPDLDINLGFSLCGEDWETYLEIVESYGETDMGADLCKFYDAEDWKNYQVLVHGIKSSSMSIGLTDVSEMAKALEMATKDENIDYVRENHAALIEKYNQFMGILKQELHL